MKRFQDHTQRESFTATYNWHCSIQWNRKRSKGLCKILMTWLHIVIQLKKHGKTPVSKRKRLGGSHQRVRKVLSWFTINALKQTWDDDEPEFGKALKRSSTDEWREAIDEEITVLEKLNWLEVIERREDKKNLHIKLVLKGKRGKSARITMYKEYMVLWENKKTSSKRMVSTQWWTSQPPNRSHIYQYKKAGM